MVIRMSVQNMRVMGRATQGVRLIRLQEEDRVASVAKVERVEGEEIEEETIVVDESLLDQDETPTNGKSEDDDNNTPTEER
jgi:DNA gyrase subunit A